MSTSQQSVFSHPEFDRHEQVAFHFDAASGLRAIIAVHSTRLGRALGGCRMWPYANDVEALTDVLRLSRGMTYKAALAGLPQGGGKSVIIGDPRRDKTAQLMRAMGRFVESFGGRYVVAEDSGTSVADIRLMSTHTAHVGGLAEAGAVGHDGDPSPATALGIFIGLQAAVRAGLGRGTCAGLRVAIQGVGNVGSRLAHLLHEAGAELWVADLHAEAARRCAAETDAQVVSIDAIHAQAVDVFAPCALGAVLNDHTIPELHAKVVAGAANNQLAAPRHGQALYDRGILYAPDYVINAGGIIDIHYQGPDYDAERVRRHLLRIGETLEAIFERSRREHRPTDAVADALARSRLERADVAG